MVPAWRNNQTTNRLTKGIYMELKDFFFASKHAEGTVMPIPLPNGEPTGESLRVAGPACDKGVFAARDYLRAYTAIKEELADLDAKCALKKDWTEYNAEMNWRADELNDVFAAAVVVGWTLEDEFTPAALEMLLKEYKGLGTLVADHFHKSKKELAGK